MQRLGFALTLIFSIVPVACSAADEPGNFSGTPGTGGIPSSVGTGGEPAATGGLPPASGGTPAASGGTPPASSGGSSTRDPSAFDWPESNPDGGSARLCKPGRYVGTYKCTVTGPPGAPAVAFELTGPVDLRLEQSQEGEFLVVNGGKLTTSAGFLTLNAGLTGKLDCQTGKFEGSLVNGELSIPPFPPGGTVGGTLTGSFQSATSALDGTWDLEAGTAFPGYGCEGPWSLTWSEE